MSSMCCLQLFCIHSVNTHIEPHILISHVSEDDGLFTEGLTVSPLVVKGLKLIFCPADFVDCWLNSKLIVYGKYVLVLQRIDISQCSLKILIFQSYPWNLFKQFASQM